MTSSATMANNRGSVHDGGHLPVVFVGVMALVPLVPWDHSVDANIGLGLPVSPRPFREVVAYITVVDCHMVFVLWPLLCFLSSLGSPSISHFSVSISASPHEIMGGCWYIDVDTLRHSSPHSSSYPPTQYCNLRLGRVVRLTL